MSDPERSAKKSMTTNPAILGLLFLCATLSGCQSSGGSRAPAFSGYESPYPKGSAVAISPALERDAIRSLQSYLRKQYGDDRFEITARRTLGPRQEFIIDSKGRMVSGDLHEVWTINIFGKMTEHEFIMYPDGKGGNFVGFREYGK